VTEDKMDSMSLSKLQEIVKDRKAWRAAVHGVAKDLSKCCQGCSEIRTIMGCWYRHMFTVLLSI